MKIKGKSFFRVVYFIPAIIMSAAVAMIWRWMFNSDYGIINYILNIFGMGSVQFLSNPHLYDDTENRSCNGSVTKYGSLFL